jgi:hypothetical protein
MSLRARDSSALALSRSAFPIHDRSGAGSIGAETSRMRGSEVGVDAKAWGRGIDCGAGALAQAVSSTRSALQVRKRIVTSFHQAGGRLKSGPLGSMPARTYVAGACGTGWHGAGQEGTRRDFDSQSSRAVTR